MHEMSIAQSILDLLIDASNAQKFTYIKKVRLEIGIFSTIEVSALEFCFDVVTKDSLAENAKLEIVNIGGKGWCMQCSQSIELLQREVQCPVCNSYQVQVSSGDEMRILDLEVE